MEITLFGRKLFIKKAAAFLIITILVIGSGVLGYYLKQIYQPLSNSVIEESNTKLIESKVSEPSEEILEAEREKEIEIKVYVLGCVNKPGVVSIKKGQVIDDAIKTAGGATKEADLENINLAYKLNENTMLRIKPKGLKAVSADKVNILNNKTLPEGPADSAYNKKANKNNKENNPTTKSKNSLAAADSVMNSGIDIITDSLGAVVEEEEDKGKNQSGSSSLININKATQAELENLPNVGPATAKAIIEYREKNGEFKKLTDIMKITGIKQKTYDKIKEFITIE